MKLIKLIAAILLFSSCGNNDHDVKDVDVDSTGIADTVYTPIKDPGSAYELVDAKGYYVWDVDMKKKTLRKNPALAASAYIDLDSVIKGLNQQYENILLEKVSTRNDTIILKIKDSEYLSNQIGSTGAAQYIAQAVINLTSVPGIRYVVIAFKEGDHASPGIWSRKDFPGYIIVQ
ncbi:MAG: hypothetical protein ABI741_03595 [Ferruginibacter sp.]